MGLGYLEGVTHDYVRHGTTTLFAALDLATGTVFTQCQPRHRHQEFFAFLRRLDACIPPELQVHLIVDNYATHKQSKVRTWLAQRPRYHIHYTSNLFFLAQSGGTLVRPDHATCHSPWLVPQRQGPGPENRWLRAALQPIQSALCLDRNR
jgi:transposase